MKNNTWKVVVVLCIFFFSTIIWMSIVFNNLLDFLLAVWIVLFCVMLSVCVFVVMSILLYDYMIHK